jgi:hypothetical protein
MHPVIGAAVQEVVATFGQDEVHVRELTDGSQWLTVRNRDIGAEWTPSVVDLSVKLLLTYPNPPPYPFYLPATLRRANAAVINNLTTAVVDGIEYGQLSLNRPFDPSKETLSSRLVGVLDWIRTWPPGH